MSLNEFKFLEVEFSRIEDYQEKKNLYKTVDFSETETMPLF